jgi:hypothetical protein
MQIMMVQTNLNRIQLPEPLMPALLLLILSLFTGPWVEAAQLSSIIDELNLRALESTFDPTKVDTLLGNSGKQLTMSERRSGAVLVSTGILRPSDLNDETQIIRALERYRLWSIGKSDHLMGPFGDSVTLSRLDKIGDHGELLKEKAFINSLHQLLSKGVITGYDLRKVNINEGFDPERTLTYSHSSVMHLKQLSALLKSENITGLLYAAPKISAFLFRDDWGEPGNNVATLNDGTRVVNGREWVVFFEFDNAAAKHDFHRTVTRYAKKDDEDEQGLIADAWWQPFYYSETRIEEFEHINLILLRSDTTEATLTVLPGKVESVTAALSDQTWNMTIEDVWVNKPFYRFLQGGYK